LFRQCAVTISVAMVISAINALTLSPALCSIFVRPSNGGQKRGIMGWVLGGIDRTRHGYTAVVRRLVRFSVVSLLIVRLRGRYLFRCAAHADGLFAGRGSGRLLRRGSIAGRRVGVAD
jgi:multidrug efflux pump subunit AcrB